MKRRSGDEKIWQQEQRKVKQDSDGAWLVGSGSGRDGVGITSSL